MASTVDLKAMLTFWEKSLGMVPHFWSLAPPIHLPLDHGTWGYGKSKA